MPNRHKTRILRAGMEPKRVQNLTGRDFMYPANGRRYKVMRILSTINDNWLAQSLSLKPSDEDWHIRVTGNEILAAIAEKLGDSMVPKFARVTYATS